MAITYELALKLKEAGFSFKTGTVHEAYNTKGEIIGWKNHVKGEVMVYIPTLSELIEACGDNMWNLVRVSGNKKWHLWTFKNKDNATEHLQSDEYDFPEEAVANLYLALHNQ